MANVFTALENDPDGYEGRKVSTALTEAGERVAVITSYPERVLELTFIRPSVAFPFKQTVRDFLCYAKNNGYDRVKLTDDALFPRGDCKYSALFFRVLSENKSSLYVDQGFHPMEAFSADKLDAAKNTLYTTTLAVGKELIPALTPPPTENDFFRPLETILAALRDEQDTAQRFGGWITAAERECLGMKQLIDKIDGIAAKNERQPIEGLSPDAAKFLKAWRFYRKAHSKLYREPVCPEVGGGLRPRKRATSRRRHKRRITRTNRRAGKGSHRTRTARKKI